MEEWDLVAIGSWPITDDVIRSGAHLLYSLRALYMRRPKAKAGAAKHRRMKYFACSWLIDLSSRPIGELHFVRSIVPVVAINSGYQASQSLVVRYLLAEPAGADGLESIRTMST